MIDDIDLKLKVESLSNLINQYKLHGSEECWENILQLSREIYPYRNRLNPDSRFVLYAIRNQDPKSERLI